MLVIYLALAVVGSIGIWYAGEPDAARASEQISTYMVLYEPGPVWRKGLAPVRQPGGHEHRAYVQRLFGEGVIRSAGPLDDGGSLMVIRAPDETAARAIIDADPAVSSGILVPAMVRRWEPRRRH